MPNAPCLDDEATDAPFRVTLHVDHAAAAREAVLVARLEHAEAPIARVHGELPLLDLPRMRRVDLVASVVACVLGEIRGRKGEPATDAA